MVEFLTDYGLFLAKALTFGAVVLIIIAAVAQANRGGKNDSSGHIEVKHINDELNG